MAAGEGTLGPWTGADLASTALQAAGIGADDGLPLQIRFVANIAKLIRRRIAEDSAGSDPKQLAVFLLRPHPVGLDLPSPPRRVPMLDNGLTALSGRLWLVGGGPASGFYSDCVPPTDQELFELVEFTLKEGHCPTIIYDPRSTVPEARYYPQGLSQPDQYQFLSITTETVNYDRVVGVVDAVYAASLVTPDAQPVEGKLWKEQGKWWPSSTAENFVQLNLKAGLAGAFPTCTIRHEQHMAEGRLDLEIEQSDPLDRSQVTRHAVLELKVLRSFGETGAPYSAKETEEWVEAGVIQAHAYRISKGALWSALFCFDMRTQPSGQNCFAKVVSLAKQLEVLVRCWHLFATSKQYRTFIASSS